MTNFDAIKKQEQTFHMPTYARFDVALVRGQGAATWDADGKEYIDLTSGIGVNALGFSDPGWVNAVCEQTAALQHTSNLYYHPAQTALAEQLCTLTGLDKVFFGNSGAEANECATKLARKYSFDKYGAGRHNIITLYNSFHGRTVTTLSATGQEEFHQSFFPFTKGFVHVPAGDLDALKTAADHTVCAVMLEVVQGEGGVVPLDQDYLKGVADFCKANDILLILDEVQTGIGRTGKLLAYQYFGLSPDIVTLAKGLGGGLPVGACLCATRLGSVLSVGSHGSTFGGNPVVCAGANYILNVVSAPEFLAEVVAKGETFRQKLLAMDNVAGVTGLGLMIGIALKSGNAKAFAVECAKQGVLLLTAKEKLRMLPPLNITEEQIDKALGILAGVIT